MQLVDRDVRLRLHQRLNPIRMRGQCVLLVAPHPTGRQRTRLTPALHQLDRATPAHPETIRRRATRTPTRHRLELTFP